MNCKCGCGREVEAREKGRPGEYYSGACRVRSHRQKGKGVTKLSAGQTLVTKVPDIVEIASASGTKLPALKPILKYPGSKARLAEWIISFFPAHTHYVEPYCGSAAVFFLKKPSEHEVLNDLNSSIVNLFRVIRSRGSELAQAIEMTPWSEEEYALVERNCTDGDEVEQARRFLVRCWQAHGGTLHQVSGWKHNGLNGHAYPVRLWRQLPSRLLAVVDRLKDAEIRNRPALEIIDYYNAPDCLMYCDPPYVLSTRGRKYYPYEMDDSQHLALLDALDAHKGPVVLSGYGCPLYDERLSHWQRVTLPAVAEHGKQRTEVLWLNRCASVGQQGRLFE
ncbi:MAG TPA: DNA adenine methylase [Ktedonobacteraceae bacterium]|nr:DNA adenine methylase [Ktedonobacteraceae bacterium]